MKNTTSNLPPKLQAFASLLDAQPPEVQEAFQFLLATAMQEAGKSELLNAADVEGWWHYTFKSSAGDVFSMMRPQISKKVGRRIRNSDEQIGELGYKLYGITDETELSRRVHLLTVSKR